MASKAEPKDSRPDLGPCPAMHPYPGFTPCASCGGLRAWEGRDGGGWVSPMGAPHSCTETHKHLAAIGAAEAGAHTGRTGGMKGSICHRHWNAM